MAGLDRHGGVQRIDRSHIIALLVRMLCLRLSELLIHAADVEGLCRGIDQDLVERLGEWCSIPTTYAGGARRT